MESQFDSFSNTKSRRHLSAFELSGKPNLSVIFSSICSASALISKVTEILSPAILLSINIMTSFFIGLQEIHYNEDGALLKSYTKTLNNINNVNDLCSLISPLNFKADFILQQLPHNQINISDVLTIIKISNSKNFCESQRIKKYLSNSACRFQFFL